MSELITIAIGASITLVYGVFSFLIQLQMNNLRRELDNKDKLIDELQEEMKTKADKSELTKVENDNRGLCTRLGNQEVNSATISGKIDVVWQAVKHLE